MSIQITYELQKSELECCICYDDISPPIIQCSSGNHFVCHPCKQKINSKCPICRTSKLFHNQLLEKQLTSYFEPCGYSKCNKRVFKWSVEQHSKSCYYQPAKCFHCNCLVELNELKSHLRLECGTEWLEYSEQETSSSLDFLSFWKQTNDGFRINLKDLCRNFVLIIDEMFLFFKQNADENWSIGLIDLKEHSVIDVHFSTIQSSNYSSTTVLTLHSKSTLYELNLLQQLPSIPLGVESIEIIPKIEIDDASVEGFFNNLFAQQL